MNNTKKFLFYIAIAVILFIGITLIDSFIKKTKAKEIEASSPVLIGIEGEVEVDAHEVGLSGLTDTPLPEEDTLENYPERVEILNTGVLGPTSLPDEALQTLPEYMSQYFDYYLDNGTNYYGEILEDSIKDDMNLPSFIVYIEDLDLEIECIYHKMRGFYYMYSRLDSEE